VYRVLANGRALRRTRVVVKRAMSGWVTTPVVRSRYQRHGFKGSCKLPWERLCQLPDL